MPENVFFLINLGTAYSINRDRKNAILYFEQAICIQPGLIDAHLKLALEFREDGQFDNAIKAYNKALSFQPNSAEIYNSLGNTYKHKNCIENAKEAYLKAIEIKPSFARAHYNLGNLFLYLGRPEEAIKAFNKAIEADESFYQAYNNLGIALEEQGNFSFALKAYKTALSINSNFHQAASNIVKLPLRTVDIESLKLCEHLTSVDSTWPSQQNHLFFQANFLKHQSQLDKSFSKFYAANKTARASSNSDLKKEISAGIKNLDRMKDWKPIKSNKAINLKKVFILGPSRSGKSSLEQLVSTDTSVLRLYEGVNFNSLTHQQSHMPDSTNKTFTNLFNRSEEEILLDGYDTILSTNSDSIFYADILYDLLSSSHFIIMRRNLKDVGAEIFTKEYTNNLEYAYDPKTIEKFLSLYSDACNTILSKIPERCLIVEYDNVVEKPLETLKRICKFLSKEFKPKSPINKFEDRSIKSLFREHYITLTSNLELKRS